MGTIDDLADDLDELARELDAELAQIAALLDEGWPALLAAVADWPNDDAPRPD